MTTPDDDTWWDEATEAYISNGIPQRVWKRFSQWKWKRRDDFILAMVANRVADMEKARGRALDEALERSRGEPLTIEAIVDARLLPVAEQAVESILTQGAFQKGLARLFSESGEFKRRMLHEVFPESTARFLHELERALPGLCAEEVEERFWMSHGSILGSLGMLDKYHDESQPTKGEQAMWMQVHLLRDAMCGLFYAPSRSDFHQVMVHLRDGSRQWQIPRETVSTIRADGDYTQLWQQDGTSHYLRRTLKQWEEILLPPQFLRVHRGVIVNMEHILETLHDSLKLKGDPEPVSVSRRRMGEVESAHEAYHTLEQGWMGKHQS